jgi:hypothetical protein
MCSVLRSSRKTPALDTGAAFNERLANFALSALISAANL